MNSSTSGAGNPSRRRASGQRDPDSFPLSDEHRREIERRLEAFKRDPSAGSSWEEVRARIKKRSSVPRET
jgi:putative addiction module component (TIGR02574 family)